MSPRLRKLRDWRHNDRPGRPWAAMARPVGMAHRVGVVRHPAAEIEPVRPPVAPWGGVRDGRDPLHELRRNGWRP